MTPVSLTGSLVSASCVMFMRFIFLLLLAVTALCLSACMCVQHHDTNIHRGVSCHKDSLALFGGHMYSVSLYLSACFVNQDGEDVVAE